MGVDLHKRTNYLKKLQKFSKKQCNKNFFNLLNFVAFYKDHFWGEFFTIILVCRICWSLCSCGWVTVLFLCCMPIKGDQEAG